MQDKNSVKNGNEMSYQEVKMNRKVLGWNINQRSGLGKGIPELVFQELLAQDADIIVLTEVVKNDSLNSFIQKMREAGYESAISKNENTNEV